MTRPSRNTNRILLDTGKEMIRAAGLSGLSVRQLAARTGVNLGMFHYHFKTKEAFGRRALQEIYEEFFKTFRLESSSRGTPEKQLERALIAFGRFARDNRSLALSIIKDLLEKEQEAFRFVTTNIPRHLTILLELVKQCQRRGSLRPIAPEAALAFLAGSVVAPFIIIALLERVIGMGLPLKGSSELRSLLLSDQIIFQRVEMALKGLRSDTKRGWKKR
ncbi:MAG TPA: TetR/AcrR family transcriptional regulator [Elusimicrobiota bacterium]|nr:TetR/AcrR family transcriptional regulator [Elusimicrobiota bacterium]